MKRFKLPAKAGRNEISIYIPEEGMEASLRARHAVILREIVLSDFLPAIQIVGLTHLEVRGVRDGCLIVEIDAQHFVGRVTGEKPIQMTPEEIEKLAFAYCDVTFEVS